MADFEVFQQEAFVEPQSIPGKVQVPIAGAEERVQAFRTFEELDDGLLAKGQRVSGAVVAGFDKSPDFHKPITEFFHEMKAGSFRADLIGMKKNEAADRAINLQFDLLEVPAIVGGFIAENIVGVLQGAEAGVEQILVETGMSRRKAKGTIKSATDLAIIAGAAALPMLGPMGMVVEVGKAVKAGEIAAEAGAIRIGQRRELREKIAKAEGAAFGPAAKVTPKAAIADAEAAALIDKSVNETLAEAVKRMDVNAVVAEAKEGMFVQTLDPKFVEKITDGFRAFMKDKDVDVSGMSAQKVSVSVMELLSSGQLSTTQLVDDLRKHGVSPAELGVYFGTSTSDAAKILNFSSQMARVLTAAGANLEMREAFNSVRGMRRTINVDAEDLETARRLAERGLGRDALTVLQIAATARLRTQLRNAFSTGTEVIATSFSDLVNGAISGVLTPNAPDRVNTWSGLFALSELLMRSPKSRVEKFKQIANADPKIARAVQGSLMEGLVYGNTIITRGGKTVNTGIKAIASLGAVQERTARNWVFFSNLRADMARQGLNMEKVMSGGGDIPRNSLNFAATRAREATFSRTPIKGGSNFDSVGASFIDIVNRTAGAGFTTLFPRYLFNHAQKLNEFMNPLQVLKLATGKERARMRRGDFKTIGDFTVGAATLGLAWDIVNDKYDDLRPGGRPGEIQVGEGLVTDTKPLGPRIAPYLYVADFIKRANIVGEAENAGTVRKETLKNVFEGFFGNAPQTKAGLDVIDNAIKGLKDIKRPEDMQKAVTAYLSGIGSVLLTPLRDVYEVLKSGDDFNDVVEGITGKRWQDLDDLAEELRVKRAFTLDPTGQLKAVADPTGRLEGAVTGEEPVPAPIRTSPTRPSPLRETKVNVPGIGEVPEHVFDTLGFNVESQTDFERELFDLGFTDIDVRVRTLDNRATALAHQLMGPVAETYGRTLMSSEIYQRMPPVERRFVMAELMTEAKRQAFATIKENFPEVAVDQGLKRLGLIKFNLVRELLKKSDVDLGEIQSIVDTQLDELVNKMLRVRK